MKKHGLTTFFILLLAGCGGETSQNTQQSPFLGGDPIVISPPPPPPPPPVVPINNAPTISYTLEGDAIFQQPFTIKVTLSDVDENDTLTLLTKNLPSWLTWDNEKKEFHGQPDRVMDILGIELGVTDGKDTTYTSAFSIKVQTPTFLNLSIPLPDGKAGNNELSLYFVRNNETPIEIKQTENKLTFPYLNDSFRGYQVFIIWQKTGFAPWYQWVGEYSTLFTDLPNTLIIPATYLNAWSPTPQSTAYIHSILKKSQNNGFSVFNSGAINLYHSAISYDMIKTLSEFYYLSIFGDIAHNDLFNINEILNNDRETLDNEPFISVNFINQMKVAFKANLVNDKFFNELLNDAWLNIENTFGGDTLKLTQGMWYISPVHALDTAVDKGDIITLDPTLTHGNYQDDPNKQVTLKYTTEGMTVTHQSSYDLGALYMDKKELTFLGLPTETQHELTTLLAQSNEISTPVTQTINQQKIKFIYQTPYGQTIAKENKVTTFTFPDHDALNITTERNVNLIKDDDLFLLLWKFNEKKFDFILPLPTVKGELYTWLDIYDLGVVKEKIANKWVVTSWEWSYNNSENTLVFTNNAKHLRYEIKIKREPPLIKTGNEKESSWSFGTVNTLFINKVKQSTTLSSLFLHAKVHDSKYSLVPSFDNTFVLNDGNTERKKLIGANTLYFTQEQFTLSMHSDNAAWLPDRIGFAVFDDASKLNSPLWVYNVRYEPKGSINCVSDLIDCFYFYAPKTTENKVDLPLFSLRNEQGGDEQLIIPILNGTLGLFVLESTQGVFDNAGVPYSLSANTLLQSHYTPQQYQIYQIKNNTFETLLLNSKIPQ